MAKYVNSQRGNKHNLLCDELNHLYRIHTHSDNKLKSYYKCVIDKCPAKLHTPFGSPKILQKLNEHNHAVNKDKVNVCDTCGEAFTNAGNLKVHINRVHKGLKDYQCETCGRDFANTARPINSLKDHIMYVHEGVKKDKKHKCDYCDKAYVDSIDLKGIN